MKTQLYVIIGAYGSGKSEYAIHLAREKKAQGENVVLVDMDVVNPYFRSREIRSEFIAEGMDIIAPENEYSFTDVPMLSPRIMGAIQDNSQTVILDVGGDPAGCRTLARFTQAISIRGYKMVFVINTKRPFTSTSDEITQMKKALEEASQLQISEFVCNANLMEYTDAQIVGEGISIINKVAINTSTPFYHYLVLDKYEDLVPDSLKGKVRKIMKYTLRKPWEITAQKGL